MISSKEKTRNHFDRTAEDYDNSEDGRFVEGMYGVLGEEILKSNGTRILDVGCGNGNLFEFLGQKSYEMFGVDFSQNMISEAKAKAIPDASFLVADAEMLPFKDSEFDIVVCNASFHHYIHPDAVLQEMHRVLKDGGKLLIGDPYVPGFARPFVNVLVRFSDKGDYHFYGFDEMSEILERNGFSAVSSKRTGEHTALHTAEKW